MRTAAVVLCALVISSGCVGMDTSFDIQGTPESATDAGTTPKEPTTPSSAQYDVNVERIEDLVHEKMNERRKENGVDPLERNETLDAVARYKSWDMAQRNYFAHEGPNDIKHSEFREQFNSKCKEYGQNIYYDNSTSGLKNGQAILDNPQYISEKSVHLLLNSSGHRQNALDPDYDSQGIGVFVDENGTVYLTQELCG